jgi:regulator of protease activity HflC (stomatin/prohibitin superfamily)
LVALALTGCGCEEIDSGHVGVVKVFGAVQPATLPEGFNWTNLFASVVEVNAQTVPMSSEANCVSHDLQEVHTKVTVQYAPAADKAICLVQKFGSDDGAWSLGILEPAIQEVTKAVSAKYTAEELVTKRSEVKFGIEQGLNDFVAKTLHARGCDNGLHIANVAVTNFEFSKEFNASIEAKVKAEQDALRAENEKRQKITQAEAKAKEETLAADANAYSTEVEAKARALAIKVESDALRGNEDLIRLRTAERWNGALPTYSGGALPFLTLSPSGK